MIIDISKYQPVVNYEQLKNEVDGVIIRAVSTNSNGLYIDPYFEQHYNGCKQYNIPVGAYFFSYAKNIPEVNKELDVFKQAIDGKIFELPLVIDYEDSATARAAGRQNATDVVIHALNTIESWRGYAMYYTFKSFKDNYLDKSRLPSDRYDFWLAWWTTKEPSDICGLWQYTSSGTIAAINGRVDMSKAYKNYPSIIQKAGLNNFAIVSDIVPAEPEPLEPAPVPAEQDDTITMLKTLIELVKRLLKFFGI